MTISFQTCVLAKWENVGNENRRKSKRNEREFETKRENEIVRVHGVRQVGTGSTRLTHISKNHSFKIVCRQRSAGYNAEARSSTRCISPVSRRPAFGGKRIALRNSRDGRLRSLRSLAFKPTTKLVNRKRPLHRHLRQWHSACFCLLNLRRLRKNVNGLKEKGNDGKTLS